MSYCLDYESACESTHFAIGVPMAAAAADHRSPEEEELVRCTAEA